MLGINIFRWTFPSENKILHSQSIRSFHSDADITRCVWLLKFWCYVLPLFLQFHIGNILVNFGKMGVMFLLLTLNTYANVSTVQSNVVCHLTPVNPRVVLLQGSHKRQRVIHHLCAIWHLSIQPKTCKHIFIKLCPGTMENVSSSRNLECQSKASFFKRF